MTIRDGIREAGMYKPAQASWRTAPASSKREGVKGEMSPGNTLIQKTLEQKCKTKCESHTG